MPAKPRVNFMKNTSLKDADIYLEKGEISQRNKENEEINNGRRNYYVVENSRTRSLNVMIGN